MPDKIPEDEIIDVECHACHKTFPIHPQSDSDDDTEIEIVVICPYKDCRAKNKITVPKRFAEKGTILRGKL